MVIAGTDGESIEASDIAFFLAPRINAAGRLENMRLGVELLLSDNEVQAMAYAQALDAINKERRELQSTMLEEAEAIVQEMPKVNGCVHVVYKSTWHAGVVGLVASKIKEAYHRPTVAFAPGEAGTGLLHGSARSIPGFHLRDAFALVDTRHPGLIVKFGGHAMAAGLTIREDDLHAFHNAFESVVMTTMDPILLQPVLWTDGPLSLQDLSVETARALENAGPWGQAFPEPCFQNTFRVIGRTMIGKGHVKFLLEDLSGEKQFEAMAFNAWDDSILTPWIKIVYALELNIWNGRTTLQLRVLNHVYLDEGPVS
jgi:single-stranded-DNA-specific exonuclease